METGDPNVLAFLKDAEKIRPMSKKERDHCLESRWMSESLNRLVEEFIPFIVMVAYGYRERTKTLSFLDLINEGILGAYAAFDRNRKGGPLTKWRVNHYIKTGIRSAVLRDNSQGFADVPYDECTPCDDDLKDENDFIDDINGEWLRLHLTNVIMENLGERDGGIVVDYYLGDESDLELLSVKYNLTRERVRQITRNFSKLYGKVEHLKSIREL